MFHQSDSMVPAMALHMLHKALIQLRVQWNLYLMDTLGPA